MSRYRYQQGSGHLVLFAVIFVAILGALGFVGYNAWQRQMSNAGGEASLGTSSEAVIAYDLAVGAENENGSYTMDPNGNLISDFRNSNIYDLKDISDDNKWVLARADHESVSALSVDGEEQYTYEGVVLNSSPDCGQTYQEVNSMRFGATSDSSLPPSLVYTVDKRSCSDYSVLSSSLRTASVNDNAPTSLINFNGKRVTVRDTGTNGNMLLDIYKDGSTSYMITNKTGGVIVKQSRNVILSPASKLSGSGSRMVYRDRSSQNFIANLNLTQKKKLSSTIGWNIVKISKNGSLILYNDNNSSTTKTRISIYNVNTQQSTPLDKRIATTTGGGVSHHGARFSPDEQWVFYVYKDVDAKKLQIKKVRINGQDRSVVKNFTYTKDAQLTLMGSW